MKKVIFMTILFCLIIVSQSKAQWAIGNAPIHSFNPSVALRNFGGAQIQIALASGGGAFSGQAQNGDAVIRTTGGGNTLFSIQGAWTSADNRKFVFTREDATLMEIFATGQVKIGNVIVPSAANSGYKLLVGGGICTEQLKVALSNTADWADYVFAKNYKLPTLSYVEKFINANQHLPNIPSAQELVNQGIDVVQMQAKLLEKIEELTLYVIELNKKNKALEVEVKKIKNQDKP
jgi:hypothetical protein